MDLLNALILGIIQGLTEFIPVSSKGHLVIAQNLLQNFTEPPVLFDAVLHLGTAAVIIFYFRKRFKEILTNPRLVGLVALATIPVAFAGYVFKHRIEELFTNVQLTGVCFIFMGTVLFFADRRQNGGKTASETTWLDALLIGLAQVFALIPGISRSGSTISSGIFRGLDKKFAMEFSFLLSVPAILGAAALKIKDALHAGGVELHLLPFAFGFISAAVVGYLTIKVLMNFLQKQRMYMFSIYLWIAGTLVLVLFR